MVKTKLVEHKIYSNIEFVKYVALILLTGVPTLSWAFVAGPVDLTRSEKSVLVESWDNKADVTVTEKWINDTTEPQVISLVLPTTGVSTTPKIFWDTEGQGVWGLEMEVAARTVYELARNFKNPTWLNTLDKRFNAWWQVSDLSLEPGETKTLKYQYTTDLDFYQNWHFGTVYMADGKKTKKLTVDLVRAGEAQHWWASLGDWKSERGPQAWAQRWEAEDLTITENLNFFATDNAAASLNFDYGRQGYQVDFKTPQVQTFGRTLVVFDTSGSLYGARAERLQKAFKTLLEQIPQNTQIRLAAADKTLEWLNDDWELNSRENQQVWLETLAGMPYQGKSDWPEITAEITKFSESTDSQVALAVLGDFEDLEVSGRERLSTWPGRVLMIDFWQAESAFLSSWWPRFNSQYVSLFNSGYELVEADLIARAWRRLSFTWAGEKDLDPNPENFKPRLLESQHNQWQVTQLPAAGVAAQAPWVPRWWAGRKLANYLRQSLNENLNEEKVLAVQAIADTFGVKAPNLEDANNAKWQQIQQLESGKFLNEDIRHWGSEPFYTLDGVWQTQQWNTAQPRGNRPTLELWGEAHKNLFLTEPELLATPLSFGFSRFCAGQRCGSVEALGQTEVNSTDTLLWSDTGTDHWALNYWADLVWRDVILEPNLNHQAWAEPISRGQFVDYLVRFLEPTAVLPSVDNTTFSDIDETQLGAKQALWLHQEGLFKGYSDGTARLNQPLKRIEALKLLMITQGLGVRDVLGNYDAKVPLTDLEGWTQPWGMEAYLRGLVRGYDDNTLRPFQPLTQAEAFKLLVESEKLLKAEAL